MMYHQNFMFAPFHGVLMLLFWAVVIYFIVWLVRKAPTTTGTKNSALEILKERYAKGEITKEEFEGMKKDLE